MEELKSTEILDREIEADAKKKAARILKDAENAAAERKTGSEQRLAEELDREKRRFEELVKARKAESAARLALDKRRLECERVERGLEDAMAAFLGALERESLIKIVQAAFVQRVEAVFAGDFSSLAALSPRISYRFLSRSELDALLRAAFPLDSSAWEKTETAEGGVFGAADLSVVFDTPSVRIRASAGDEGLELLSEKRTELCAALWGAEYA
jgi:V/A-type H+-transporting ATPase subunit E